MIRVSQWAEVRYMHEVEGVSKKEIVRRPGLNIRTVRRALEQDVFALQRRSPCRGSILDAQRMRIELLLKREPELTANRIARLLDGQDPLPRELAMRETVANLRKRLFAPEAFLQRTQASNKPSKFDLEESRAQIPGKIWMGPVDHWCAWPGGQLPSACARLQGKPRARTCAFD